MSEAAHENLLRSPVASRFVRDDHELIDIYGMAEPLVVDDPLEEYRAIREGAALLDFSPLFKVDVHGRAAKEKLNAIVTRDIGSLPAGRIAYTPIVGEDGLMRDDVTIMARSDDRVRVVGGPPMPGEIIPFAEANGLSAVERRDDFAHLNIQGPRSREVLSALTDEDVSNEAFPYYTFKDGVRIGGLDGVFVTRMGYTAELGYELFVPSDHALEIYDALMEAGAPAGLRPVGVAAIMMVRVEAGMVMGELEYDPGISPWECGLGWAVTLDKGSFRGRDALRRLREERTDRLVSVILARGEDAASEAPLLVDGRRVGAITMAVPSPYLQGRTLGLARVAGEHAAPGTKVVATVGDEEIPGEIAATPVYDPERRRVKS
jgi:aminomethyltransferase